MKVMMKRLGMLILALIISAGMLPMQNTKAKGNTCVKGLRALKMGKKYSYDIDGDGQKDTIYWVIKENKNEEKILYVYVNKKKIYSLNQNGIEDRRVSLCNIDNKDDYVELLVEDTDLNLNMKNCAFLRYNKGKVSTLFRSNGKEKIKRYGIATFGRWTVKGNGIVIHKNSSCFSTYTTGCIEVQVPLKLNNGKLVYASKNQYKLTYGKYNYQAGNKIKVYKDARIKSGIAFTMKGGERFRASKLRVMKWSKCEGGYYTGTKFFLQIKTKDGKKGWVYIPSETDQTQDFTGGGNVTLPAWN